MRESENDFLSLLEKIRYINKSKQIIFKQDQISVQKSDITPIHQNSHKKLAK